MEDKKFYSLMTFIFGIIGLLCAVIMICILLQSIYTKIKFGNEPYLYCSCIIIFCFICNRFLYKRGEKNELSTAGSLFGFLSLIPIILFFMILILVLGMGPFLINYNPTVYGILSTFQLITQI